MTEEEEPYWDKDHTYYNDQEDYNESHSHYIHNTSYKYPSLPFYECQERIDNSPRYRSEPWG